MIVITIGSQSGGRMQKRKMKLPCHDAGKDWKYLPSELLGFGCYLQVDIGLFYET